MLCGEYLIIIQLVCGRVYMSVPTPDLPLPFPLVTINLLSKSVSLFLLCKGVHLPHFGELLHVNDVFVFLCLTSFT